MPLDAQAVFYVYMMFRPDTGMPCYVGKGKGDRYRIMTRRNAYLQRLIDRFGGSLFSLKFAEGLTEDEAHEFEISLIAEFGRGRSGILANLTDGGRGLLGVSHSAIARRKMSAAQGSPDDRFWARVNKSGPIAVGMNTPCWLWTGGVECGYGRVADNGGTRKRTMAYLIAYEKCVGPFPKHPLVPTHLCNDRGCVNPDHLEFATRRELVLRGDGPTAKNALKTCCVKGHPFDEKNTYSRPSRPGNRECTACQRFDSRENKRRVRRAQGALLHGIGNKHTDAARAKMSAAAIARERQKREIRATLMAQQSEVAC